MEKKLQQHLQDGEKILWTGRPEGVKLMEKPYHTSIIIRIISSLVFLAMTVAYIVFVEGETMIGVVIFLLAVAIYLVVDPILIVNKLNNKTLYCLTNQRAIIFFNVGREGQTKSKMIDDIQEVSFDRLSTGKGTVYFGAKSKESAKYSRLQSTMPALSDREENPPLMFYSVDKPAALCDICLGQLA